MEPKTNVTKLFIVYGGHRDILVQNVVTAVPAISKIVKYINDIDVMHSDQ